MPGQYREFASWLGAKGTHEIVFLSQRRNNPKIGGVRTVQYAPHHKPAQDAFGLSKVSSRGHVSDGYVPNSNAILLYIQSVQSNPVQLCCTVLKVEDLQHRLW